MKELTSGAQAPVFELTGLDGQVYRLADQRGKIVVLVFWSAECPWSRQYDAWLSAQASRWAAEGVELWAVASNVNEPRESLAQVVSERQLTFPLLLDEGCRVADLYGAQTTPHVFVIDPAGRLVYRGAIDDRTFRQRTATVNYLEQTLQAIRQGRRPSPDETPAYGCAIVRFLEEP